MLRKKLRVLVVDDTIVYRKAVSDIMEELPEVELVGVAHNGKIAMSKIRTLKPDLLTLDIEMPVMNGLEVLAEIQKNNLNVGAIMLSTLTSEGGEMTLRALELGAFDFILKPQSKNQTEGKKEIKSLIHPMIKAFARSSLASSQLRKSSVSAPSGRPLLRRPLVSESIESVTRAEAIPSTHRGRSEIIAIGVSTGGPNALTQVLPKLPGNIGIPIIIVQHMPPVFTKSLAASLNKKCELTVKEAEDRESLQNNTVYIAPGGKQMKLVAGADGRNRQIKITNDPPENSCRPSVDYLFRSVADYYVNRSTAVIMTGMGSDGTKGLQVLRNKGCFIIAQDEKSCVVYGMPKSPIESGLVDIVAPLDKLADEILKTLK
ncbi:protein-glutamate methylesterase/protein-glutamine glutaminase [Desulfopila inferna]|uniref:protein-glutamate methylesterase/protein-glutamine glutaminase n=1 Tax=Desulfopila inferna TaxID=468528 RepID=UPI0019668380|nr:chemotaxis response regulator protein-glutamate methylesterase [Desulfopila inferna]MBM9602956.1 chemotaxis response regulator protein-glutamate methylesterase [Desulfopila inferna]